MQSLHQGLIFSSIFVAILHCDGSISRSGVKTPHNEAVRPHTGTWGSMGFRWTIPRTYIHVNWLTTPETGPLPLCLSNMDEGATWRLNDPHFQSSGERPIQLQLMKHITGRGNSAATDDTSRRTKAVSDESTRAGTPVSFVMCVQKTVH